MDRRGVAQVLLLDDSWSNEMKENILNENGSGTWIINTDVPYCITSSRQTQIVQKLIPVILPQPLFFYKE